MGHYYAQTETGVEPRHYVSMTSRPDELRPTRITDVRKWWKNGEEVVPSVTTVGDVLAKYALINWKIDQHLEQAYYQQGESWRDKEKYFAEIKRLTELEMDKAPSAGSDFHKLMEEYVNTGICSDEWETLCNDVLDVIEQTTGTRSGDWETETNFVFNGYGGQIDLIPPEWIIDYKTKQTADKFKPGKMVYPEHKMQLSAYRKGVNPNARCANVFVCLEDGQIDFHEHKEEELEKGWELFHHALMIWQIQNKWHDRRSPN